MRRLFISLYVALAAAILVCVLVVPWLITTSFRSSFNRYGERLAAAPQYLFEQELQGVPQAQWPDAMKALQDHFGYALTLQQIDDVTTDQATRDRLRRGLAALPPQTGNVISADAMLLPIGGSGQAVTIRFSESPEENTDRGLGGIYYLLERRLDRAGAARRPAELAALSARFSIPMKLLPPGGVSLEPEQLQRLDRHQVVGLGENLNGDERYVKLIADGSAILQIGPLPVPGALPYVQILAYLGIALVFALMTFLWIRPLWRDMRLLDQRAAQFGTGDLGARVGISAASAVFPLARTFNSMADRVQALITAQRELANAVSHELRTPLSRLRFAIEMLESRSTDADTSRFVEGMKGDIRELEELVDETLTYARLTSPSGFALHPGPVDLASLVAEMVEANRRLPGAASITHDIALHPAEVVVDQRQLSRALDNLVRNARQHAASRVHVAVGNPDGLLEIVVDDDGPGVPPAQREAIFQPFHRLDSSRSRETGGYGLGLAIARRILDLHGAQVTVEDSPLGGARFRVRFSST